MPLNKFYESTGSNALIAIDPGVHESGIAVFSNGVLTSAFLAKREGEIIELKDTVSRELVIEKPQVYVRGRGDPNDLIDLAIVVGELSATFRLANFKITHYKPREWKGTVDADVMTKRIQTWLTVTEKQKITKCAASKAHNVVDAIGLGVVHLRKTGVRK